jgi:hypothetical protein
MRYGQIVMILLSGFGFLLMGGEASASFLTVCNVKDQSAEDLNPIEGSVQVFFCSTGNGTFSGTATEMVGPNNDTIIVRGTLAGSGSLPVSNMYDFGEWVGPGTLRASLSGTLGSAVRFSLGGESIKLTDQASTFSNNPAVATASFPNSVLVPAAFNDSQTKSGEYSGQGVLSGVITYDTKGEFFTLTNSGILQANAVPEPSTLTLFGSGVLGMLCYASRRRRATA